MGKTAQRKRSMFELGVSDGREYGRPAHYILGRKDMVNAYINGIKAGLSKLTPIYSPDYADGADYGVLALEHDINMGLWGGLKRLALIAALMLAALLLFGCASIKMTTPEGASASYVRFGDQQIQGFRMERDSLGVWRVVLEKQSSDARILDAIGALVGAAK